MLSATAASAIRAGGYGGGRVAGQACSYHRSSSISAKPIPCRPPDCRRKRPTSGTRRERAACRRQWTASRRCRPYRLPTPPREANSACAPSAQELTNRRYRRKGLVDEVGRAKNRTKSKVRAKVERPSLVITGIIGFAKTCYRGLEKNTHRLFVTCLLTNRSLVRRRLLRLV